jgi:hypothetical protein
MKGVKKLLNILIVLFMVIANIRIIPCIINYEKPVGKGIVFNKDIISSSGSRGGTFIEWVIYIKSKNRIYHYNIYDEKLYSNYNFKDFVTFRNLHNGGGVLVLSKNNIKMNDYYQIYDYIMFFLFITLPFCYYILNYKLKIHESNNFFYFPS